MRYVNGSGRDIDYSNGEKFCTTCKIAYYPIDAYKGYLCPECHRKSRSQPKIKKTWERMGHISRVG